jgi:hypothetical protein
MSQPTVFTIDSDRLETLFQTYQIPVPTQGLALFALRGAKPESQVLDWVPQIQLTGTAVDYRSLHCTIGIWDSAGKRIFPCLASTVPHADQVALAAAKVGAMKGRGTNQMEPGFYQDLVKGEHLQGKLRGHQALRQSAFRFYRRSHHNAPYRSSDPLFFGNPYDNLHCAWNLAGQEPGYSSAGCLVVAGMPHCPRQSGSGENQGAWQGFHERIYAVSQKSFSLLLVSGLEVSRIFAEAKPKPRLVYGSKGEAVRGLQASLIQSKVLQTKLTGYLGQATYRAWNQAGLKGHGDVLGV